jgi:RimJ/RimL family protein N-acetyltransferase
MSDNEPLFRPLFQGKLVRLTAPREEDAAWFADWSTDDQYGRMLDDDPIRPQSPANFGHFSGGGSDPYFHVRTLMEDKLIGFVVLFNLKWASQTAEMAIGIGESTYRGKGYGSEALALLLNYAFNELNLYRVGLSVMAYNQPAIRAYERAGFVLEGARRGMVLREGRRYDLLLYGILREEWLGRQQG